MTNTLEYRDINGRSGSETHKSRLAVIQTELRSKSSKVVRQALQQIEKWLSEDPEDQDLYRLLLREAQSNPALQEKMYNLVRIKSRNGSKAATDILGYFQTNTTIVGAKRFDILKVQLRSDISSDVMKAMKQIEKWLQEAPENQDTYSLLLDAIQEKSNLQEDIQGLLEKMIERKSNAAEDALRILLNLQKSIDDADDAYYATEFDDAIDAYQKILQLWPNNIQAQGQLVKALINKMEGIGEKVDKRIPKESIQWYRKARSCISKSEPKTAIQYLKAAIDEAGVYFPEAEKLLAVTQKSLQVNEPIEGLLVPNHFAPMNSRKKQQSAPKIFISYSHVDERYKNELVKMLSPLKAKTILEIWNDRQINPGEEWYEQIQTAINTCNIALLLVSSDFLDSKFIQEHEFPHLLRRRKEERLRVVPIIISDCMWQSVPVLQEIQVLPQPVSDIKPKNSGIRAKIWKQIGVAIEAIVEEIIATSH